MFSYISIIISFIKGFFGKKTPVTNELLVTLVAAGVIFYGYNKYQNIKYNLQEYKTQYQKVLRANESLERNYKLLKNDYNEQAKQYQAQISRYKADIEKIQRLYKKEQAREKIVIKYRTKVLYVDKSKDGAVAPVLRDTLDWLRRQMQLSRTKERNNSSGKSKIH